VKWTRKVRRDVSLVESLFKQKIDTDAERHHSSSVNLKNHVAIPPFMIDLFNQIFEASDRDGDGSLSTMDLMFMLKTRAKGTPLEGDAHAIFSLKTLLAQQAASKSSTPGSSSSSSAHVDMDMIHDAGDEHGEIGPPEFAKGLTKSLILKPNGHIAEWILQELQVEAAQWSTRQHEGRTFYQHDVTGKRQWTKPVILVETERCKAEAGV
jgi:hypothetical protein